MKLRTPQKKQRRQLHQSGVNMFNRCGMQFAFRYIQGLRRPPSAFMLCGSATDKAINYDLDTKILTGELSPLDVLTDIAAQSVEKDDRADSIKLDPDEEVKGRKQVLADTKDRAVRLATMHHTQAAPKIQPWRTQRSFTVNLDKFLRVRGDLLAEEAEMIDLSPWRKLAMKRQAAALRQVAKDGLDFVGAQDVVEKFQISAPGAGWDQAQALDVLNIRDAKTSKSKKNQEWADQDDQMTAYATASMVIDGRLPDAMVFDVLVETTKKQAQTVQELQTVRQQVDVDIYLNRIANAVASMQLGIFTPTNQSNWWCSEMYCGYAHICPYFRKMERVGNPVADLEGTEKPQGDLVQILQASVAQVAAKKETDEEEATKL